MALEDLIMDPSALLEKEPELSTEVPKPPPPRDIKLTHNNIGKLRVQPVTESRQVINLMVYGDSGVGKSLLAGSATAVPEMAPVLIIDVEGGTFSLRDQYPTAEVVRVEKWADLQEVYDFLYLGKHEYKTCVLDSVTEMQKFSMYNIMQDVVKKEQDRDPDIPGLREWGKNIEQMRKMIRAFRDLPINTIYTALAMQDRNQRTGKIKNKPSMSGKLSDEVAAFLDIVCYMYMKVVDGKTQRLILTQATEEIVAKDRSNRLPQVIQDITMRNIYDLIYGKNQ